MKIPTADLELGMFVAQLDRPWLETPFLFQGFEIHEEGELKLLRQFCQHVYVDVTRGSMAQDKVLALRRGHADRNEFVPPPRVRTARRGLAAKFLQSLTRLDPTGTIAARLFGNRHYRNTVPTRTEAPQAIRAYDSAVDAVSDVLYQIRKGAGLDVEKVQNAVRPMIDSVMRNQDAMAWLVYLRKRDEYTYQHSIAASVWAVILGRHLGFDRAGLETLAMGGMLLDIGKAKLPDALTTKAGRLTADEMKLMRRHVQHGLQMARTTPGVNADVLAMIGSHHERADGSGYPDGLKGLDIPVFGRIAGLVDCYDAMTSQRPWAPAKSPYDAIRELNTLAGTHFQKEMVEQFVQALGMFPTGSIVELNTGEIGIVVEQNRIRRLRPKIMVVLDENQQPLSAFRSADLRERPSDENDSNALWIIRGHQPGAFGIDPKNYFIG